MVQSAVKNVTGDITGDASDGLILPKPLYYESLLQNDLVAKEIEFGEGLQYIEYKAHELFDITALEFSPTVDVNNCVIMSYEDMFRADILEGEMVNCYEFGEESSAKIEAELDKHVDRAARYAPSLLFLRNVDESLYASFSRSGLLINSDDLTKALNSLRDSQKESLGAPKIPKVSWEDIGGLDHVKEAVKDTIELPLERPELFAKGVKKRSGRISSDLHSYLQGLLFYGPPGTGKTLVAKAVATSFSLNFLSVKGPELLNMYIGESEANVRRVFEKARDARPCVIFFDELDSVAPKRGEKGDSGGVMDRIVSQLLSELDSVNDGDGGDVFVIGATNRPDLLDSALLRPGRFDKLLYLGVSDTYEKQENVLQALTRNLQDVARACPLTLTGADMYALCSDAMLKAINRTISGIDRDVGAYNRTLPGEEQVSAQYYLEAIATNEQKAVVVTFEDFKAAITELKPSVSPSDLAHYARVQEKFK
ncbi:peroxisomal assembly protein [Phlyctochytrium bullatum]|nr:peroxisomal assembly protein [Phlyctochytrium bullatum]